jgi:hypothetical protein
VSYGRARIDLDGLLQMREGVVADQQGVVIPLELAEDGQREHRHHDEGKESRDQPT